MATHSQLQQLQNEKQIELTPHEISLIQVNVFRLCRAGFSDQEARQLAMDEIKRRRLIKSESRAVRAGTGR